MLKDFLDALGKIKSRPLLIVFAVLAMSTFDPSGGPIKDPFSASSLFLPFLTAFSFVLVVSWSMLIRRLNSSLSDYDSANWGVLLGGTILAFCLCVTFWYVSNNSDAINLKLLGNEGFIRLFALYLFGIETINIQR